MKQTKQQMINKWKFLKQTFKEVNDHNSITIADCIDKRQKGAFHRAYGNKESTRVGDSFETGY